MYELLKEGSLTLAQLGSTPPLRTCFHLVHLNLGPLSLVLLCPARGQGAGTSGLVGNTSRDRSPNRVPRGSLNSFLALKHGLISHAPATPGPSDFPKEPGFSSHSGHRAGSPGNQAL